ncbi:NADH ubiquinone oxidoreductase, 20 kda subunit [Roseibium sp. TrichSKD4]|nr:NADH ubiquinone oxidoreductase, 20 kda subunit [Roseibium sp. TrichSKD4]
MSNKTVTGDKRKFDLFRIGIAAPKFPLALGLPASGGVFRKRGFLENPVR